MELEGRQARHTSNGRSRVIVLVERPVTDRFHTASLEDEMTSFCVISSLGNHAVRLGESFYKIPIEGAIFSIVRERSGVLGNEAYGVLAASCFPSCSFESVDMCEIFAPCANSVRITLTVRP